MSSLGQAMANPGIGQLHPIKEWARRETLVGFFYAIMIKSPIDRDVALRYVSDNVLEEAIGYANTKEMRRTLLRAKRDRVFREGSRFSSIIINEIAGLHDFAKKAKKYYKATVRLYLNA